MRPKLWSYTPVTTSATGFASNVTGATWTLTATAPTDGLAHQVTIHNDAATDHSAKTAVLVGTDADGKALTETLNLPAGTATVTSVNYYRTLTSVTPSATINADTMDIGWTVPAYGPTIPIDFQENQFNIGVCVDISGTINYTIQYTPADVFNLSNPAQGAGSTVNWIDMASPFAGATADQAAATTVPCRAYRVKINTVTNGATLKFSLIQATF